MRKLIAVTIGDIKGIGIHLLIKEWKEGNLKNIIILTNIKIFKNISNIYKLKLNILENENEIINYDNNKLNILNIFTKNIYTNSYDSLKEAYFLSKKNRFIGILTLPINKKEN